MNCKPLASLSLLLLAGVSFAAAQSPSLLPPFAAEGADFTVTAKDGNKTKGWLPKSWVDNSEWAAVSATYTKLNDPPKTGLTAVRIKVEKVDEGQLQLTSYTKPPFKKDVKYVVTGWIRSPENAGIKVGVRQPGEPYEFYAEQELSGTQEWKPFAFDFSFSEDKEAFVMFTKPETGTVDLADIAVREKK